MKTIRTFFDKYRLDLFCCAILGAVVFFIQGHLLFTSQYVISGEHQDIQSLFYYLQDMVQDSLRHGKIIKWNPYMFGGAPFLGEGQELQFYPIRWILAVFPTAQALNWYFTIHVWLMGINMYCWMRFRGLRRAAALVSGAAIMLCGAFFAHQLAGHTVMGTYAWAPLIFLGIDGWFRRRHFGWILLAAAAAALQIYAGFFQLFYLTALFAGLYALFGLVKCERRLSAIGGLAAIYPIALLLAAVQFLPTVGATFEGVRSHGMISSNLIGVPLENLLLVFTPWLYGGGNEIGYWGRIAGIHEVLPFMGCGVLFLATLSFIPLKWGGRVKRIILILLPLLLAMGSATPLYKLAYNYIPLYNLFRSEFRPIFIYALFMAFAAGYGINYILKGNRVPRGIIVAFSVLGLILIGAGISIAKGDDTWFHGLIRHIQTPPFHYHQTILDTPAKLETAIQGASKTCIESGVLMLLFSLLAALSARKALARLLIPVLCIVELAIFAAPLAQSIPISKTKDEALAAFLKENPGDYRSLFGFETQYIGMQAEGLWGYNPVLIRRYAELLFHSQGYDPDTVSADINIRKSARTWDLLRVKYAMTKNAAGITGMQQIGMPFPRFFIAGNYRVMADRNAILDTLESPLFDLRNEVILEEDPGITTSGSPVSVNIDVVGHTTDRWIIHVTTDKPGILVMTDAYSRGWRATALSGNSPKEYKLLPADWALRGIPLQAGEHRIKIEYIPWGYHAGIIITLGTLLAIIAMVAIPRIRRRLNFAPASPDAPATAL